MDSDHKIYVVTYLDDGEPVVTLFDNQEAANKCYQYLKNYYTVCCVDECEVCSSFVVS